MVATLALRLAAQIAVVAHAPDTVVARTPFTVTVQVSSPAAERAQLVPLIPTRVAPFRLVGERKAIRIDTTSGWVAWRHTEYRLTLVAPRAGAFVLPSFEARSNAIVGRSLPLRIAVVDTRGAGAPLPVVARVPLDSTEGVGFHALVLPETVYVGQQATYQVGVFLGDDVRLRLRRNPEFVPPELRAMLAYDLPPAQSGPLTRRERGRRWDVHVFERALFPLTPGTYEIPPARLAYSLPLSQSFFSREESRTARSERRVLVVRDAPAVDRPADWNGAVGALALSARVDSSTGRVGDPLLLTVRVSGRANVKLLPRPTLDIPWASVVAADERVELDSVPTVVSGAKEFDFIVTPRQAGRLALPPVRYPVFNPYTEKYEILAAAPDSLEITPGTLAASEPVKVDTLAPLPALRAMLRPAPPPPPYGRGWFWLAGLLAPLPAAGAALARRPRRARLQRPHERLRALARARVRPGAGTLRKTYARALAERLGLSAAVLTERGALAHAMRRAGVTTETAAAAAALLAELSDAAWAGRERLPDDAPRRAWELWRAVDVEARPDPHAPLRPGARAPLLLLVAGGALGGAALAGGALGAGPAREADARALFVRASTLYQQRRAPESARLFERAARLVPRAPDAWANYGTAAFVAGDTASAVVGWQRALRLEPLALDVRERLANVGTPGAGLAGWVPPLSPASGALAALAAWYLAWGALWVAVRRRSLMARGWGIAAATVAGILAVVTTVAHEAGQARRLAVVAGGVLRVAPALAAEPLPGELAVGSLARVTRRQGVWTHVVVGDDREGWIASDALRPLAD